MKFIVEVCEQVVPTLAELFSAGVSWHHVVSTWVLSRRLFASIPLLRTSEFLLMCMVVMVTVQFRAMLSMRFR